MALTKGTKIIAGGEKSQASNIDYDDKDLKLGGVTNVQAAIEKVANDYVSTKPTDDITINATNGYFHLNTSSDISLNSGNDCAEFVNDEGEIHLCGDGEVRLTGSYLSVHMDDYGTFSGDMTFNDIIYADKKLIFGNEDSDENITVEKNDACDAIVVSKGLNVDTKIKTSTIEDYDGAEQTAKIDLSAADTGSTVKLSASGEDQSASIEIHGTGSESYIDFDATELRLNAASTVSVGNQDSTEYATVNADTIYLDSYGGEVYIRSNDGDVYLYAHKDYYDKGTGGSEINLCDDISMYTATDDIFINCGFQDNYNKDLRVKANDITIENKNGEVLRNLRNSLEFSTDTANTELRELNQYKDSSGNWHNKKPGFGTFSTTVGEKIGVDSDGVYLLMSWSKDGSDYGHIIAGDDSTGDGDGSLWHTALDSDDNVPGTFREILDSSNYTKYIGSGGGAVTGHKHWSARRGYNVSVEESTLAAWAQQDWGYDYVLNGKNLTMFIYGYSYANDRTGRTIHYQLPYTMREGIGYILSSDAEIALFNGHNNSYGYRVDEISNTNRISVRNLRYRATGYTGPSTYLDSSGTGRFVLVIKGIIV